ncbi:hypothetical protein PFISCL1PPCAC_23966 [Pristionchus fissidentatus]|uniref:SSD domain-containing protein n=1 Tax=Pristionchus fissidentatus TaxID=1538716 RepID=A0AAV5WPR6_9BILA|nr:hypothetical protein PFISCL1PPCAC_23966 [Pristionchus fissidentatus]
MIQPLSFPSTFCIKAPDIRDVREGRMLFRGALLNLGEIIGRRPLIFALPSFLLAVLAVAAFMFTPREMIFNMETGFASRNAESHRANELQISFFQGAGKPWYMGLFAEPKNLTSGNMLNSVEYGEFAGFYKGMKKDLVIMSNERGNFTFMDYCGDMCSLNDPLFKMMGVHNLVGWLSGMTIQWPVTKVMQFNANIGKHLFKRTEGANREVTDVDLGALYFMLFVNGTEMQTALENFEKALYTEANRHNSDPNTKTNLIVHSAVGMEGEIKRGLVVVGGYAGIGAILLFAFLFAAISIESFLHSRFSLRSLLLAFVAFILPVLSTASAFALLSILSVPFSILTMMTPIVSIALCVDGSLHLLHSWLNAEKEKKYDSNEQQLGYVFEHCVASVLINGLSFVPLALGVFLPTDAFGNLFLALSLTAAFATFYLVFLFTPVVVLLIPRKRHEKINQETNEPRESFCAWISRAYSTSIILRLLSLAFICLALAGTVYSINANLHSNLDYRSLLPPDSASRKGAGIMTDVVWPDLLHIIFFVESPPDFGQPEQYGAFMQFLNESQHLPYALGKEADQAWIYDFKLITNTPESADRLNMSHFKAFITHEVYSAWNSGVQYTWNADGTPHIDRMIVMVAFNGTRSLSGKARLINQCRTVAAKYPQFDLVPFDTEVSMVDVLNELPQFAVGFPIAFSLFVFLLFLLFSPNVASALVAAFTTFCLEFITFGISLWIGMELNPFTIGFLIILSSIAGRLVIHLTFHYHETGIYKEKGDDNSGNRVTRTLLMAAIPTLLSSLIGVILVIPFIFNPIHMFTYFGLLGAIHLGVGLLFSCLFLPLLLSTIPRSLIGGGIIYTRD